MPSTKSADGKGIILQRGLRSRWICMLAKNGTSGWTPILTIEGTSSLTSAGAVLVRQIEPGCIKRGVGHELGAIGLVVGEAMKGRGQLHQLRLDRGIMRVAAATLLAEPGQRRIIVMPTWIHRHDVRFAFAQRASGASPAPQLDIAGVIQFALVEADQRFQVASGELLQNLVVPGKFRIGITVRPREMGHPRRSTG